MTKNPEQSSTPNSEPKDPTNQVFDSFTFLRHLLGDKMPLKSDNFADAIDEIEEKGQRWNPDEETEEITPQPPTDDTP